MTGADIAASGFDYAQLDADLAARMRGAADRVRGLVRASVIDVGRELLGVKDRLKHGQFVAWVEAECRLPVRTAQRAMRVAELVTKNASLAYLPPDGLEALVSRSAPKLIVPEIIEQIEAGVRPTAAAIKRRIAAAGPEKAARLLEASGADDPSVSMNPGSLSSEEQLTALMAVWERAGPEARRAFLGKIGATLVTPKVEGGARSETIVADAGDDFAATALIMNAEHQRSRLSEPSVLALDRPDADRFLEMASEAEDRPSTPSEASPDGRLATGKPPAASPPPPAPMGTSMGVFAPRVAQPLTPNEDAEQQGATSTNTAATPTARSAQGNISTETSGPSPEPPPDDGGLLAIWERLKPNPQKWASWWVANGFPNLSNHSAQFDLAVLERFCAAARRATPQQIERFRLEVAERSKWAA